MEVTHPNQLWEVDLKYGYIDGENRHFYILPIMDIYSRKIVNYNIGLRCTGKDLVFTLQTALKENKADIEERGIVRNYSYRESGN